ncbi:acyltransferase [Mesorhizobium sp. M0012]|uniref:acyltransferase family protein n=1 Tax=Mesorhizobium sp. M0012 TaxID=2956840 RepID=UPI00333C232F
MADRAGFREDINALRAIAVLSVMLFHFQVPGFSGGFSGVDIFFVISGYLMTNIIFRRVENGRFSLLGFYVDRARRIVPALAMLCVTLIVVGWFILVPSEFQLLGKHTAGAMTFVSNFFFWSEAGYFDRSARAKWLLHTWSLSVEWQFYILYPVIVIAASRLLQQRVVAILVIAVAIASYALSVRLTHTAPTADFYLLPPRAWEMLAGGVVYLFPIDRYLRGITPRAIELAGLALILTTVFFFAESVKWPGWRAIVPVLGTMLTIWARRNDSGLICNRMTTWIGLRSYSIYLWHWPIVVALNYFNMAHDAVWIGAGIAATFGVGHLSYRLVELPSQRLLRALDGSGFIPKLTELLVPAVVPVVIICASAGIWSARGMPQRFGPAVRMAAAAAADRNPYIKDCFPHTGEPLPACIIGGSGTGIAVEMIGDSHAVSVETALADAIPNGWGKVRFSAYAACPTIRTATSTLPDSQCFAFNQRFLTALIDGPPSATPVVIVNYWHAYLETKPVVFVADTHKPDGPVLPFTAQQFETGLTDTICAIAAKRPVYLTLPFPDFPARLPETVARALIGDLHSPDVTQPLADVRARHAEATAILQRVATRCGAHLLDPLPALCPGGQCLGSVDHRPLYLDDNHLNEYGNRRLVPMFAAVFAVVESSIKVK